MAAQVLSFFQRSPRYTPAPASDWSQQELAEFYRVEAALLRAGIRVGTDRGLSDEKEPWFVFYRTDDGEVVIHFARIDGEYLIAGPAYEEVARGFDFSSMVRNMVARHPLIRRSDRGDNISIHPAALLVAVVGTAFFKTGEARAAESGAANPAASHARPALLSSSSSSSLTGGAAASPVVAAANASQLGYDTVQLPANQAILVLAAALLAADFKLDSAGLEPGAQTALASAAAALDFAGPSTSDPVSTSLGDSVADSHAAAITNTPAQTVSSVLSLVALLSTLPQSTDPSGATDASNIPTDLDARAANLDTRAVEPTPAIAHAPQPFIDETSNWSLQVRLGAGALPNVEAVQLVRALVGDAAAAQKITVIEVSKLPDVLAEIISRGEHVQVAPVGAATPVASDGITDGVSSPLAPQPSSDADKDATATKPDSSPQNYHFVGVPADLVSQFIDYFIAHTAHIGIMMQGSQVVMYDERVLTDPGAIHDLGNLVFDFADSSLSLIGARSALLNDGHLF